MREKLILTDADGTIVKWLPAFVKFMENEKGFQLQPGHETEYRMSLKYGIPSEDMEGIIREFNESSRIVDLEPLADSTEYIGKLADAGFKFIVITAQSLAPIAKVHRTECLVRNFGNVFQDIQCIEMGARKKETLSQWKDSGLYWVEDHPARAHDGLVNGLKSVLISHVYNSHVTDDKLIQVSVESPWKEIYQMVMKDYNLL